MKKIALLTAIVSLAVVGCNSFINQVKNSRMTSIDLTYSAYTTWTNYYMIETNKATATPADLAKLNDASKTIKDARLKFVAADGVLKGWIDSYNTNSGVKLNVQSALDATLASSSNFVWLVNFFKGQ